MARDGSGTFDLAEAAFVNGSTIDADAVNSDLSDIASGLTDSLAKDGQTVPTASLPMGGFKHTGVADGAARTDYASLGQVAKGSVFYAADTGAADAYVIAPSPGIAANAVGFKAVWKVANANLTTTPTLATNSLTAGTIVWPDGSALAIGDLPANAIVETVIAALASTTPTWHLLTAAKPYAANAIGNSIVDAKGDLIAASADNTPAKLTVGANGTIPMARSASTVGLAYVAALNGAIYGLTYANNAGDATNDLDIAAGGCMDATGAYWITLAAITKQSDVAWAVGTNAGGLDTGSVGDHDYYIWAIARSDTGVTDILYSLSSTAPMMPTNYDFKRLIGWFKRASSTIVAFKTYETASGGLEYKWSAPTLDVNQGDTLTTTRRTDAVKVPLNFSVMAILRILMFDVTTGFNAIVCCPDETDAAPSNSASPGVNFNSNSTSTFPNAEMFIRTSAAGLIAARADLATVDAYRVWTVGFQWSRR